VKKEWNEIYKNGKELNIYPSEVLVSWAYRNKIVKSQKALDIGCGFANNLRFLIEYGLDAYGIDNSDYIIDAIRDEFNQRVSVQSIKSTTFNSDSFDILVDRQSIQHNFVSDLSKIYSECRRIIKMNGLMFSVFQLTEGNGATKAVIDEHLLDQKISEYFTIKEKNYHMQTTNNGRNKHDSIVYTLLKE